MGLAWRCRDSGEQCLYENTILVFSVVDVVCVVGGGGAGGVVGAMVLLLPVVVVMILVMVGSSPCFS